MKITNDRTLKKRERGKNKTQMLLSNKTAQTYSFYSKL